MTTKCLTYSGNDQYHLLSRPFISCIKPGDKAPHFFRILTTNVRTLTSIAVVLPKDIHVNVSLFIALRPPSLVSKSEKTGLIHTFSEFSKIYLCTFPCRDANTVLSSGKKIYTEDGS